jgi:hypothetical protein
MQAQVRVLLYNRGEEIEHAFRIREDIAPEKYRSVAVFSSQYYASNHAALRSLSWDIL